VEISAEWILEFVSVHTGEDGSSTGQIVRRAENGKVQGAVYKWLFVKRFTKPNTFWASSL
jgi:hypothetical protein